MKTKADATPVTTDSFREDLFEGYIKPEKLLETEDAKKVREAIKVIEDFKRALEDADLLELT